MADVKLSLAQEAVASIAGYGNRHVLSRGHAEQTPSPSDADLGEAEAGKRRAVLAQRLAEMRGRIEEIREHNGTPFGTMRGTGVVFRFWRDKGRDGAHIEMGPHLRAVPKSEGLIDLYHLHPYGHDPYH